MARTLRRLSLPFCAVVLFLGVAVLLTAPPRLARGAAFSIPDWTHNSPAPECRACTGCGCPGPAQFSPEGVHFPTGELVLDRFLGDVSAPVGRTAFSLRYRSMISGVSQFGNFVPWYPTAKLEVLIPGAPNNPGGRQVVVSYPDGTQHEFVWNGSAYSAPACGTDTLTEAAGQVTLTDKYGNEWVLHLGSRMPVSFTDRNGNTDTYTLVAGTSQLSSITTARGETISFTSNANKYVQTLQDGAGRTWTFTYDPSDRLVGVRSPATPDQPAGVTWAWGYDSSGRLVSATDGKGHTTTYTYVGATAQVASVTGSPTVTYSYSSGLTTRVDGNGNEHRHFYTGNQITKTDMVVGGVAQHAYTYAWSGNVVVTVVTPKGSRVDYTWNSLDHLVAERRKETNTASSSASDILHSWGYDAAGRWRTFYADPLGNVWVYTRDAQGNLTAVSHPTVSSPTSQSASRTITYNAKGQVTKVTREDGVEVTYAYGTTGPEKDRLVSVVEDAAPGGLELETQYLYDAAGNVISSTSPNGATTTATFDALRRLVQTTAPAPLGYVRAFSYDGEGNLLRRTVNTASGALVTSYTYGGHDELLTMTEPVDAAGTSTRTTTYQYDDNFNRIRMIRPLGTQQNFVYDERDLLVEHVLGEGDPAAATTTWSHDANGNRTKVTDPLGNDTTTTVDLFDRPTRVTNALGHYTETTYDKAGRVTKVERKDSSDTVLQRRSFFHDERGRLWKISDLRKEPGTTYADAVTTLYRDAAGRRTKSTDAASNVTESVYDANGNAIAWSVTESDGATPVTHAYEAQYDELDRMVKRVEIDRLTPTNRLETTWQWDSRSNRISEVTPQGNVTFWHYDGLSRLVSRARDLTLSAGGAPTPSIHQQVTTWQFDDNDRLIAHVDDGQNASTWSYDALDRVTQMVYPDGGSITYQHDAAGNVTQITDPVGSVISDTYDALHRRTARSITLAAGYGGTTTETYAYDALDRLIQASDNDAVVTQTYGDLGLASFVYEEQQSYAVGSALPKTVKTTRDANGWRKNLHYPGGLTLTHTRNALGLLTGIGDGLATIASFTHVGARPRSTTFENGTVTTTSYTGFRGEVASVNHQTSLGGTVVRLEYGYDPNHDRLYERFGGPGSPGDAFAYDGLRRLATAWQNAADPTVTPPLGTYTSRIDYVMDDDGNRRAVAVTPFGGSSTLTPYTTNNAYQYTSVGAIPYAWDANGNLTSDTTRTFVYDYRNQLVEVKDALLGTTIAAYRYDALGRRIEKAVGPGVSRYVYDGLETVEVYDGSDTLRQTFVFGDGIDQVLMLEQADVLDYDGDFDTTETTRSYYHRNALGSVMEITDMNETVAVSYRYAPYGAVTITVGGTPQSSDPLGNPWMFTARFQDEEPGLMYYRARHYAPGVGRFLQRDPLGYRVGPNLFEYVRSSPANLTDPSGREPATATATAIVIVVSAALSLAIALCVDSDADDPCECSLQISATRLASAQRNPATSREEDSLIVSFRPSIPADCDVDADCLAPCREWAERVEAKVKAYSQQVNESGEGAPPDVVDVLAGQVSGGVGVEFVRHVWWDKGREYDRSAPVYYPLDGESDAFWDPSVYSSWRVTHWVANCG